MEPGSSEHQALLPLLPEERLGAVHRIQAIGGGLSGAGVYTVTASRGDYVLRIQAARPGIVPWTEQLLILRRAAEGGVAPEIVHVDEAARAIVSARVAGVPLAAALSDPAQRGGVLMELVERLRVLHGLETTGVSERDPVLYAREVGRAQQKRSGFPKWAAGIDANIGAIADLLGDDPRRVLNHNDVNPGNVIWDGARAWLVDWDGAGLGHPHYDLATLAMFLNLGDEAQQGLIGLHDGAPPDAAALVLFAALRRLSALLCGVTFLSMVPDLSVAPESASTLSDCYAGMRSGALNLETAEGRVVFGLALLQVGMA